MNRLYMLIIMGVALLLGSCQASTFQTPEKDSEFLFVSHIKEPTMTFIDTEEEKVMFSEESSTILSEMVEIDEQKVLATSLNSNSLLYLDLAKGMSKPFMEINQGLSDIRYLSDEKLLFVTDRLNDQVHIIDLPHKDLIHSVDVGSFPTEIEIIEDQLFVLSGDTNEVTVIDYLTGEATAKFPVMERPAGMYYDGDVVWLGGHGSIGQLNEKVIAYDPKTYEPIAEVDVGLMPVAFYSEPKSPHLFVLCHGDHALYKVDKTSFEVIDSMEVGQNPNYITGHEGTLYVSNFDSNSISIINETAFELEKEISVSAGPYAMIVGELK